MVSKSRRAGRRCAGFVYGKTCIHCGICVNESKAHGVELKHGNLLIFRDRKEDWRHLADSCPSGALCLDTKEYTSDALVEEALKIKCFPLWRRGNNQWRRTLLSK